MLSSNKPWWLISVSNFSVSCYVLMLPFNKKYYLLPPLTFSTPSERTATNINNVLFHKMSISVHTMKAVNISIWVILNIINLNDKFCKNTKEINASVHQGQAVLNQELSIKQYILHIEVIFFPIRNDLVNYPIGAIHHHLHKCTSPKMNHIRLKEVIWLLKRRWFDESNVSILL